MHSEISPLMRSALDATIARLADELRGVFSRETVTRDVEESFEQTGDRPTVGPNFLPVIIERFAREQLWAAAQSQGRVEKGLPEVLFVCERNAGRSQMAAALADHPGKRYEDWPVADPAGQPLEVVRRIRYELYHRVGADRDAHAPGEPLTPRLHPGRSC